MWCVFDPLARSRHGRLTADGQILEDGLDFKKKVEEVLDESGFTESRAAKMDINDLLK